MTSKQYENGFDDGVRSKTVDADDILKAVVQLIVVAAAGALVYLGKVEGGIFSHLAVGTVSGSIAHAQPRRKA